MILVNGVATDQVAATDRGLAYGDGVFRTFPVMDDHVPAWRLQYQKLSRDCSALGLPCPEASQLSSEIRQAVAGLPECVVKIIITRGSGPRGYWPEPQPHVTRIVLATPGFPYPPELAHTGVKVRVCRTRLASQPRLAGIKHLNRLENVLARAEWNDRETAEGLMLDAGGNVIGGTMTNLFIVDETGMSTPDLSSCGVAGVTRERVLMAAARTGARCRIEVLPLDRVLAARELILVNSLVGIWPVREIEGRTWQPGPQAAHISEWLRDEND